MVGDRAERIEIGRSLRKDVPRSSHGEFVPAADRPDPVEMLEGQNADRLQWLVPIRRARMMASPFAFYRGSARIMATDLATTPNTGIGVQVCGDAHLANFGVFASPERTLMFDLNDFDETLPGPWEWDIKRLAASFTIAGRHRGSDEETCRELSAHVSRSYRAGIERFAESSILDTWYAHLPIERLLELDTDQLSKKRTKRAKKFISKAKSRDHLRELGRLAELTDEGWQIRDDPPLLQPLRKLPQTEDPERRREIVESSWESYLQSIDEDKKLLLSRYRISDVAVKVVGVGSVGTRCSIVLLVGDGPEDVLFLQVKEATRSVLEEHLPNSRFRNHGRRVVEGQRLMQATSDMLLGWSAGVSGRNFYWRQLKDWKGSADLDSGDRAAIDRYAELCGWTLARAHAVSGDPVAISAYLGSGTVFDQAMAEFSHRYADQNEADHAAFVDAVESGELEAHLEL